MMAGAQLTLRGRAVLLLGGTGGMTAERPNSETFPQDEQDIRVEEAVIALARAVFIRGGQLALQDDPVVTPLVLEVAYDYWQSLPGEESAHSSEGRRIPSTQVVIFLPTESSPHAELVYEAERIGLAQRRPEWDFKGLEFARTVVVGGAGRDAATHAGLIERAGAPAFAIASTARGRYLEAPGLIDIERRVLPRVRDLQAAMRFQPPRPESGGPGQDDASRGMPGRTEEAVPDFVYAAYPLIMGEIFSPEHDERRPR